MSETAIGPHLQDVRKRRGVTQRELADRSGISISLIRKLEQGERRDARLETVRSLAVALRVPTTRLVSPTREEPQAGQDTEADWEPVRRALTNPVEQPEEPATVPGLTEAIDSAIPVYVSGRVDALAEILPKMIRDADSATAVDPAARSVRSRILGLTGKVLTQTRQLDAAEWALEQASDDADDRHQAAAVTSTRCWVLLRRGRLAEARSLAAKWADDLEPRLSRATRSDLAAWGWLLLRLTAAAQRDNATGESASALRLAKSAAVAMGHEHGKLFMLDDFGPTTVARMQVESAMIADRPDDALTLSSRIRSDSSNNFWRHRLDVARAQHRTQRRGEATETLHDIWRQAPEWLPHQQYGRDVLQEIIDERRTLTPETRALADAVGVPL